MVLIKGSLPTVIYSPVTLFSGTSSPDGRDPIMRFIFRALPLRALLNYERRLKSMRTGSLGGR